MKFETVRLDSDELETLFERAVWDIKNNFDNKKCDEFRKRKIIISWEFTPDKEDPDMVAVNLEVVTKLAPTREITIGNKNDIKQLSLFGKLEQLTEDLDKIRA